MSEDCKLPRRQESPFDFCNDEVGPLFKKVVDLVAQDMSGELILNHGIVDAWYLFKTILRKARELKMPVTILSGRMRADFYNCLTQELKGLIDEEVPVRAYLVEADGPDTEFSKEGENRFADLLRDHAGERTGLFCKDLSAQGVLESHERRHVIYAGVVGGDADDVDHAKELMYRVEKDPLTHKAFASFDASRGRRAGRFVRNVEKFLRTYFNDVDSSLQMQYWKGGGITGS